MLANPIRSTRIASLAVAFCLTLSGPGRPIAAQQLIESSTVPSQRHFQGIQQLYRGEYRDAERIFRNEARRSMKIGITSRWIDAICYHALWGEVLYNQGRLQEAFDQFNHACAMFLQYPKWMLLVEFKQPPRVDTNRLRYPIPWGTSTRQFTLGKFSDQMLVRQGDLASANRALQRGGVVTQPQFWRVNAIEIVRCTALAIRRRNQLLGPLGPHDAMSRELALALSTGAAPPNHWSGAWADLQLGLAHVGLGEIKQAEQRLQRAERVAGQFDHPLTCVALLELGRLAMQAGKTEQANQLFAEASYSAFYYEDTGVIDEAFRLASMNQFAAPTVAVNAALEPAATWAKRERFYHVLSRLRQAQAEQLMTVGDWNAAAAALKLGEPRTKEVRAGLLGSQWQFLAARLQIQQSRDAAANTLQLALDHQLRMSIRHFQLQLANFRFDRQQLRARTAAEVYQQLLGEPNAVDWVFQPLESLASQQADHRQAFERWLVALASRNDWSKVIEVTDLAKRRRYLSALAWGGRLAALRDTLEAPESTLTAEARTSRNQLLLRFPQYAAASKAGEQLRSELQTQWQPGLDDQALHDLAKRWRDWDENLRSREAMLAQIGLQRVPAANQFPRVLATTELQSRLGPGEAVLLFHDTAGGLLGFLVTATDATQWNCGPSAKLKGRLQAFLRDLGNYDANHQLTGEELAAEDWIDSGAKLADVLLQGSSIDPDSLAELVIVPDGIVWYVPFAALPVMVDEELKPLIKASRLRVAPLAGLALADPAPWRRVQRTGIVGDDLLPGSKETEKAQSLATLRGAVANPIELPTSAPAPTPVIASLLETLIVLDEVELDLAQPFNWSPIVGGRGDKGNTLSDWLRLPQLGPQRVIIPAAHTLAERGGKGSKRRPSGFAPGTELFLASCALMSGGAQTVLLSNWRVGGESTMEIVREFVQELPHTSAADAWQRSVQLAQELPLEPATEQRVKATKGDHDLTARHPFFWAGYLLIDAGALSGGEVELPDHAALGAAASDR